MFRVNYGNGQVEGPFKSKKAAADFLKSFCDGFAFLEFCDCGEWFACRKS